MKAVLVITEIQNLLIVDSGYMDVRAALGHLLELDLANPDSDIAAGLLGYPAIFYHATEKTADITSEGNLDASDVAALARLGFEVSGSAIRPANLATFPANRGLTTREKAHEQVVRHADYLQFLARLHLLAAGNARFASMLSGIGVEQDALTLTLSVPYAIALNIGRFNLPTTAIFDAGTLSRTDSPLGRFTVAAKFLYIDLGIDKPATAQGLEQLIAAALLPSLLNYQVATPYVFRPGSYALHHGGDNLASALAEAIEAGHIRACPNCARLVYETRANGSDFCRKAHQVRYHEKARRRLKRGLSVDEVAAEFPAINRATIECW